jgi:hypothetical protein
MRKSIRIIAKTDEKWYKGNGINRSATGPAQKRLKPGVIIETCGVDLGALSGRLGK